MILILAGKREDTHAVWSLGCLSSALLEKMAKDFTRQGKMKKPNYFLP